MEDNTTIEELDALFGVDQDEMEQAEKVVLTQNLHGFASCFPDWDLHPPIRTSR